MIQGNGDIRLLRRILVSFLLLVFPGVLSYRISPPSHRIQTSLAELPINASQSWQKLRFIHGGSQVAITNLLAKGLEEFTFPSWGKAKLGPGLYTTVYASGDDWTTTKEGTGWFKRIWNYERSGYIESNAPFQLVLQLSAKYSFPKIAMVGCDIWYEKNGKWTEEGSPKLECMNSHTALAVVSLSARCGIPSKGVKPACTEIHRKNLQAQGCVTLTPEEAASALESGCFMEIKWNLPMQRDLLESVAVANWPQHNKEGHEERISLFGELGSSIVSDIGSKFVAAARYRHQSVLSWVLSGSFMSGAPEEG